MTGRDQMFSDIYRENFVAEKKPEWLPVDPKQPPYPQFCYTPERCAGKTCCPKNPSCCE